MDALRYVTRICHAALSCNSLPGQRGVHRTGAVAQPPSTDGLPPGARLRLGRVGLNLGEGDTVISAAALSPDGKYVAGGRGRITLFERATGKPVASIMPMTPTMALAFAPAGNVLAVGGLRSLILVEVPSGKVLHELEISDENFNRPHGLCFSADGKVVAVGMIGAGSNKQAKAFAWNVATGKALGEFETVQNAACSTALSPDGKMLATWGRHVVRMIDEDETPGQTVQLWDIATGKELRRIKIDRPNVTVTVGAFAPDGKTFAVNSGPATFHLFDPHTGKEIRRFAGRRGVMTTLRFSRDGRLLVAGSNDGAIQAWRTSDGKRLGLVPAPKNRLLAIACPDGDHVLALGAAGQRLVWWDALTGEGSQSNLGHRLAVVGVAFTPDGKRLRSLSLDGKVVTWDPATGKRLQQMSVVDAELLRSGANPVMRLDSLSLSPDARFVATKSIFSTFRLWDLASGDVACDFEPGKRPTMTGLVFSADGSRLAAGMMQEIHIWDTDAGQKLTKLSYALPNNGMANGAPRLAYAPDGKRLTVLATSFDPNEGVTIARIALLDVASGKELRGWTFRSPATATPARRRPIWWRFRPIAASSRCPASIAMCWCCAPAPARSIAGLRSPRPARSRRLRSHPTGAPWPWPTAACRAWDRWASRSRRVRGGLNCSSWPAASCARSSRPTWAASTHSPSRRTA